MNAFPVTLVVEGDTDIPYAGQVLRVAGLGIGKVIDAGGKDRIEPQLPAYNAAAQGSPWMVLRDLDQDAPCAPSLRKSLLPEPSWLMCFRIPVRAVEAWVLGDFDSIATFLKVRPGRLPLNPENELDPKQTLVNIARSSTSSAIRDDMVPARGASRKVGPGYEARLIEFGTHHWQLHAAEKHCPSLRRCIQAVRRLSSRATP